MKLEKNALSFWHNSIGWRQRRFSHLILAHFASLARSRISMICVYNFGPLMFAMKWIDQRIQPSRFVQDHSLVGRIEHFRRLFLLRSHSFQLGWSVRRENDFRSSRRHSISLVLYNSVYSFIAFSRRSETETSGRSSRRILRNISSVDGMHDLCEEDEAEANCHRVRAREREELEEQ